MTTAIIDDEMLDELESIAAQESILDDLKAIYGNIFEQQSVSRTHMVTLEAISEGALPELYPLASFTEAPTQTNLNVALESIVGSIGKAIASFIKAIVSLFRKVINRILAFLLHRRNVVEKTEQRFEASKELTKDLDKTKKQLSDPVKAKADTIIADAQTSYVAEQKEKITLLMADVVENGPLRKEMLETGKLFEDQFALATKRMEVLRVVVKELERLKPKDLEDEPSLKKLELRSQLAKVIAKDDPVNSEAFLEKIEDLYQRLAEASKTPRSRVTPADLVRWRDRGTTKNMDFMPKRLEAEAKSRDIEKILKGLEETPVKVEDPDLTKDLRDALRSIQRTTMAFARFNACVSLTNNASTEILTILIGFIDNPVKALATYTYNEGSDKDKKLIGDLVQIHRKRVT